MANHHFKVGQASHIWLFLLFFAWDMQSVLQQAKFNANKLSKFGYLKTPKIQILTILSQKWHYKTMQHWKKNYTDMSALSGKFLVSGFVLSMCYVWWALQVIKVTACISSWKPMLELWLWQVMTTYIPLWSMMN
jgi:hypothetical protein